jgi:hypothetical protein
MSARLLVVAVLIAWSVSACVVRAVEVPMRINFDGFETAKAPPGFSADLTGGGGPVAWIVRDDPAAPSGGKVLVQTSTDTTDSRFPICVYDRLLTKNVALSVRFKTLAGSVDQAAGLIVRFRDKTNYYVVRANALEDNVRLYAVEDGRRRKFAGADVKVAGGTWHTLTIEVKMRHFAVSFNGQRLFEADDDTFPESGGIGLWTKADSVTAFDNLTIEDSDAGH